MRKLLKCVKLLSLDRKLSPTDVLGIASINNECFEFFNEETFWKNLLRSTCRINSDWRPLPNLTYLQEIILREYGKPVASGKGYTVLIAVPPYSRLPVAIKVLYRSAATYFECPLIGAPDTIGPQAEWKFNFTKYNSKSSKSCGYLTLKDPTYGALCSWKFPKYKKDEHTVYDIRVTYDNNREYLNPWAMMQMLGPGGPTNQITTHTTSEKLTNNTRQRIPNRNYEYAFRNLGLKKLPSKHLPVHLIYLNIDMRKINFVIREPRITAVIEGLPMMINFDHSGNPYDPKWEAVPIHIPKDATYLNSEAFQDGFIVRVGITNNQEFYDEHVFFMDVDGKGLPGDMEGESILAVESKSTLPVTYYNLVENKSGLHDVIRKHGTGEKIQTVDEFVATFNDSDDDGIWDLGNANPFLGLQHPTGLPEEDREHTKREIRKKYHKETIANQVYHDNPQDENFYINLKADITPNNTHLQNPWDEDPLEPPTGVGIEKENYTFDEDEAQIIRNYLQRGLPERLNTSRFHRPENRFDAVRSYPHRHDCRPQMEAQVSSVRREIWDKNVHEVEFSLQSFDEIYDDYPIPSEEDLDILNSL